MTRTINKNALKETSMMLIQNFEDELKNNDAYAILTKLKRVELASKSVHRWNGSRVNLITVLDIFDEIGLNYDDYIIEQPMSKGIYTIVGGYMSTRTGNLMKDSEGNTIMNKYGYPRYEQIPNKINRYAGVNNHAIACVLTMGELRTFFSRVYFPDEQMAQSFLKKYNEKFGERDLGFKVHKVDGRSPLRDHDILIRMPSDCGDCYQVF